MNRKVRRSVFETNSSSVHTLVFSNDGREPSRFILDKDGKIEIDFGTFGKNYEIFNTQYDKLSYLITCLYYISRGFDEEAIYDTYDFKRIEKAIMEYVPGCTGIKILGQNEPSIDHQSIPYGDIEIINIYDEDSVINFVFNKYVWLKTDCD